VHSLVFKFLCSHKILRKNKAGIFSLLLFAISVILP
jgi:hypothetical protein